MTNVLLALALARIIAGETPTCDAPAKIAVANVMQNRIEAGIPGGWFGDADPTAVDLTVAWLLVRGRLPQIAPGGLYAIGPGDKARMPWLQGRAPLISFICPATRVSVYGAP